MEMITVRELIERLQDAPRDAEVRVAIQPSYPLQVHLEGVAGVDGEDPEGDDNVVFLVASDSHPKNPYAPRNLWEEAYI